MTLWAGHNSTALYSQMLLLSGERVGQVLDIFGVVFLHVRVQRLYSFTDQRHNFLHKTTRLLHFITLELKATVLSNTPGNISLKKSDY